MTSSAQSTRLLLSHCLALVMLVCRCSWLTQCPALAMLSFQFPASLATPSRRATDRLVFLHEGRVVWEGPTPEFDRTDNPYVVQFREGLLEGPLKYV